MSEGAQPEAEAAPRLALATTRAFVVAPIRLALAIVGIVLSAVFGLERGVAIGEFLLGAGLIFIVILTTRGRRPLTVRIAEAPVPPPDARSETLFDVTRSEIFPSTVGITVLMVAALVFDARLAAVLAGLLAGAGAGALLGGAYVAWVERLNGVRLLVERGFKPKLYVERVELP